MPRRWRYSTHGVLLWVVIALLVIGGLGHATYSALRLENDHHQQLIQTEFNERLRLALWRLDSRLAPTLAREDSRPTSHYQIVHTPVVALTNTGTNWTGGEVWLPSPLLNVELPNWMLLHFMFDKVHGWQSPQVVDDELARILKRTHANVPLTNVTTARRQLFNALKQRHPRNEAIEELTRHQLPLNQVDPSQDWKELATKTGEGMPTINPDVASPLNNRASGLYNSLNSNQQSEQEFNIRQQTQARGMNESRSAFQNDMRNYPNTSFPRPNMKQLVLIEPPVEVRLGSMVPVWWGAEHEHPQQLFFVRHTIMGTEKVYQGIVLDWPMIRQELLSGITDLFPEAQLIPIVTEERPHPERSMTVIPVILDPGTVLANDLSFWTTIRIGLAVAWLAAIVALTAVALGGWSLIDLSERRIRFVSAVTHELRTPLTTLRLYLDMLTSGIVKEPQHRDEYLVTLHVEAERLHRLVDNVLDFARLEKHEPKINLQACSVQSLLDQLYQDWCGRCRTDGKELIAENHLLEGECLVTDQQLLCQLVGNLIDNARKYSRGAENPTIWLRIGRIDAHHVYVEVEDRGPGIATEDAKVIFRPFRRGSQADTIAGGVGLGLALAQRWVHLLRGTIRVQSGANRVGVCFRCELPTRFS